MAYSFKGSLSFGFVYIPVTLVTAVKNNDVSFNMIDKKTMSRVKYVKTCVDCGDRVVKQEDIVKGYEYEEGKYVIMTDEDFEKIKSEKDKNITIEKFVNISDVDPLYFDKPYYVNPIGAEKAYKVLMTAMEQQKKAAIAKAVLGNKETLIAIRVKNGQMLLNTLFFEEEIQNNPTKEIKDKPAEKELSLAKILIDSMSGKFVASEYKDEYGQKLRKAIEEKISGKEVAVPKQKNQTKISSLMEALEMSLKKNERRAAPGKK